MKFSHFLTFALFVHFCFTALAQNKSEYFKAYPVHDNDMPEWAELMYSDDPDVNEVISLYQDFYTKNTFVKTIHTQNYKHWLQQIQSHIGSSGKIVQNELSVRKKPHNRSATSVWTTIGPFETIRSSDLQPINTQVNVYNMDQSTVNPDKLAAGVEAGGLYISSNRGVSWRPAQVTITEGHQQIRAVQFDPVLENTLYYSCDYTKTLYKTNHLGGAPYPVLQNVGRIHEIKINPNNNQIVFAAADGGLYRSANGGSSWGRVSRPHQCYDVDFHPTNPNIVYMYVDDDNENARFYKSTDGGLTYTMKTSGLFYSNHPDRIMWGGKIAVSPANSNYVYLCVIADGKPEDRGWIGVYRSTDQGETWTDMDGQAGAPYGPINSDDPWNVAAYSNYGYHQAFYNFDFDVSSTDPNLLWVGTIRLSESTDGGVTFRSIGAASSTRLGVHADIQDISVKGSDIFVCSDGGIDYSSDELQSVKPRKNGINGSLYWGFGAGWNEDVLTGGRYHNGNSAYYENYPDGKHIFIGGAESATGFVDPLENRVLRYHDVPHQIIPETLPGKAVRVNQFAIMPNASYSANHSSGIYYDVVYRDWVYIGKDGVLYKSENNGDSFTELKNFGNAYVLEVEQSRQNPKVLYVSLFNRDVGTHQRGEIWRSADRGATWTKLDLSDLSSSAYVTYTVAQDDANTVLVIGHKSNDTRAILTKNGGASWMDVSDPDLAQVDVTDIFSQPTDNGMIAYVACNHTVLKFSEASKSWDFFDDGLPGLFGTPLIKPFFAANKMRMSTRAYGIYEAELEDKTKVVSQPYTASPYNDCANDLIRFESYSVTDNRNAQFTWHFYPEPESMTMIDNRAVDVSLRPSQEYDVRLTVTTPDDVHSTLIPNMIEQGPLCNYDLDQDGILDSEDDDIDGDGLFNVIERNLLKYTGEDVDQDGYNDIYDFDSDNDGETDDYELGNYCSGTGEPVFTDPLNPPSGNILVSDFDGQQHGLCLIRLRSHVNCYDTYNDIFLLVDFDSEVLYNVGYKHFYETEYTSEVLNDGSASVESKSRYFGHVYYKLINKKLYFNLASNACGSWGNIVEFCRVRSDINQNGILDYKESAITLPNLLKSFTGSVQEDHNRLNYVFSQTNGLKGLEIQKSVGLGLWQRISWVEGDQIKPNEEYEIKDFDVFSNSGFIYRLAVHSDDGEVEYSSIVSLIRPNNGAIRLVENPVDQNITLDFGSEDSEHEVTVLSMDGKTIQSWSDVQDGGIKKFDISDTRAGFYILRVRNKDTSQITQFKVLIQ